jgi:hypothetical protein
VRRKIPDPGSPQAGDKKVQNRILITSMRHTEESSIPGSYSAILPEQLPAGITHFTFEIHPKYNSPDEFIGSFLWRDGGTPLKSTNSA